MGRRPQPVLILGAEPRVAVAIARSLYQHGIPVYVAALCSEERALRSRAVRGFLRLPRPQYGRDLFALSLTSAVQRHDIDMVIPSNDTALSGLADTYDLLRSRLDGVRFGCPPPGVVRRVLDKAMTLQVARECGIAVPLTWQIEPGRDPGITVRFPAVVKPRNKMRAGQIKVRYFETPAELRRAAMTDRTLGAGMLLQEYCPGVGVGIEVFMDGDRPLAVFQHRRLKELPANGGVSVLAISEPVDPDLAEAAIALLRRLRWDGVAMVEFRRDPHSGRTVLMEVNGRYWGSLPLSRLAGLEFPYYEWQRAHGETPTVPAEYRTGIQGRWSAGALLRAHELLQDRSRPRWATVLEIVKDFLPPTRDLLWSARDPAPALAELFTTWADLMCHAVRAGLRAILPKSAMETIRCCRLLGPRDGRVFAARWLLRALRLRRERWTGLSAQTRSVLFVCHGNIIRSPMAAAALARALRELRPDVEISSAGLHAKPYGSADPRAVKIAAEFDCSLDAHQSRMITAEMVEQADAIFVMDRMNEAKLLGRFAGSRGKVWLLGACEQEGRGSDRFDILDPYEGGLEDVRRCYVRLVRCVERLAHSLGGATGSRPWPDATSERTRVEIGEAPAPESVRIS